MKRIETMREYIDEAIILNKRRQGELDSRYSIFMKRFGKMVAKATSARKVTSKLAGHLEPGTVSEIRLIETHGLQVVDALKVSPSKFSLMDLDFLDRLLAEEEPEPAVWAALRRGEWRWEVILRMLGWDPAEAVCSHCGAHPVAGFSTSRQEFFCAKCAIRMPKYDVLLIYGAVQPKRNLDK